MNHKSISNVIKRGLTFLLAFAMIATSLYVAPVANAEELDGDEVILDESSEEIIEEEIIGEGEATENDAMIVDPTVGDENHEEGLMQILDEKKTITLTSGDGAGDLLTTLSTAYHATRNPGGLQVGVWNGSSFDRKTLEVLDDNRVTPKNNYHYIVSLVGFNGTAMTLDKMDEEIEKLKYDETATVTVQVEEAMDDCGVPMAANQTETIDVTVVIEAKDGAIKIERAPDKTGALSIAKDADMLAKFQTAIKGADGVVVNQWTAPAAGKEGSWRKKTPVFTGTENGTVVITVEKVDGADVSGDGKNELDAINVDQTVAVEFEATLYGESNQIQDKLTYAIDVTVADSNKALVIDAGLKADGTTSTAVPTTSDPLEVKKDDTSNNMKDSIVAALATKVGGGGAVIGENRLVVKKSDGNGGKGTTAWQVYDNTNSVLAADKADGAVVYVLDVVGYKDADGKAVTDIKKMNIDDAGSAVISLTQKVYKESSSNWDGTTSGVGVLYCDIPIRIIKKSASAENVLTVGSFAKAVSITSAAPSDVESDQPRFDELMEWINGNVSILDGGDSLDEGTKLLYSRAESTVEAAAAGVTYQIDFTNIGDETNANNIDSEAEIESLLTGKGPISVGVEIKKCAKTGDEAITESAVYFTLTVSIADPIGTMTIADTGVQSIVIDKTGTNMYTALQELLVGNEDGTKTGILTATYIKEYSDGAAATEALPLEWTKTGTPDATVGYVDIVGMKYTTATVAVTKDSDAMAGADASSRNGFLKDMKPGTTAEIEVQIASTVVDEEDSNNKYTGEATKIITFKVRPETGTVASVALSGDVHMAIDKGNGTSLAALKKAIKDGNLVSAKAWVDGAIQDVSVVDAKPEGTEDDTIFYQWDVKSVKGDTSTIENTLEGSDVKDKDNGGMALVVKVTGMKAATSDTPIGTAIDSAGDRKVYVYPSYIFSVKNAASGVRIAEGADEEGLKAQLGITYGTYTGSVKQNDGSYKATYTDNTGFEWLEKTTDAYDGSISEGTKAYTVAMDITGLGTSETLSTVKAGKKLTATLVAKEWEDQSGTNTAVDTKNVSGINITVQASGEFDKVIVDQTAIKIGYQAAKTDRLARLAEKIVEKNAFKAYATGENGPVEITGDLIAASDLKPGDDGKYSYGDEDVIYTWKVESSTVDGAAKNTTTSGTYTIKVYKNTFKSGAITTKQVGEAAGYTGNVTVNPEDGYIKTVTAAIPTGEDTIAKSSGADMLDDLIHKVKNAVKVTYYKDGEEVDTSSVLDEADTTPDAISFVWKFESVDIENYDAKISGYKTAVNTKNELSGTGENAVNKIATALDGIKVENATNPDKVTAKIKVTSYVGKAAASEGGDNTAAKINDSGNAAIASNAVLIVRAGRIPVNFYVLDAGATTETYENNYEAMNAGYVYAGEVVGSGTIRGLGNVSRCASGSSVWYNAADGKVWNLDTDVVNEPMDLIAYNLRSSEAIKGTAATYVAAGIPSSTFNNKAYKPAVSVVKTDADGNEAVLKKSDYTVKYYNIADTTFKKAITPKDAGTYIARINIKKDKDVFIPVTFSILQKEVPNNFAEIKPVELNARTNIGKLSVLKSVKYGKLTLKLGTDYTYTVSDASANAVVSEGAKNATEFKYGGTKDIKFTFKANSNFKSANNDGISTSYVSVAIKDRLVKNAKIKVGTATLAKGGSPIAFTVTMGKMGTYSYNPDTDVYSYSGEGRANGEIKNADGNKLFDVYFTDIDKVGKGKIRIEGNDEDYFGFKEQTYSIKASKKKLSKKILSGDLATLNKKTVAYTGDDWTLEDILMKGMGESNVKTLDEAIAKINAETGDAAYGSAFTVSYAKNINAGTATVTFNAVPGSGWTGSFKQTFKIAKVDLKDVYSNENKSGRFKVLDSTALGSPDKADNANFKPSANGKTWELSDDAISKLVNDTLAFSAAEGIAKPNTTLNVGQDFTVSYGGNKAVSTTKTTDMTITIKGKGNYAGKTANIIIKRGTESSSTK